MVELVKRARLSPLFECGDGLAITEVRPFYSILRVRGGKPADFRSLGEAFGLNWPTSPNQRATRNDCEVMSVGPAEWAVRGCAPHLVAERAAARLAEVPHHVADLTDGCAQWRVEGPNARAFLAKGCALDLHPRVFTPFSCARTLFGQVEMVLTVDRDHEFIVLTDVSVRRYVQERLLSAFAEWRFVSIVVDDHDVADRVTASS